MQENELTYLAAAIPELAKCERHHLCDVYFPSSVEHPTLRIRDKDGEHMITKKVLVDPNDASIQREQNIPLNVNEFKALACGDGRELEKTRYLYPYKGRIAEVDIFGGSLTGLVLVEFEFETPEEKEKFAQTMPPFCLADVTQEDFIAGGMLAGKSYTDLTDKLEQFGYQPLHLR